MEEAPIPCKTPLSLICQALLPSVKNLIGVVEPTALISKAAEAALSCAFVLPLYLILIFVVLFLHPKLQQN